MIVDDSAGSNKPDAEAPKRGPGRPGNSDSRRAQLRKTKAFYEERLRGVVRREAETPRPLGNDELSAALAILEDSYRRVLGDVTLTEFDVARFGLKLADRLIGLARARHDQEFLTRVEALRLLIEERTRPMARAEVVEGIATLVPLEQTRPQLA